MPEFTRDFHRIGSDDVLRALQLELLGNSAKGDVIRGTGGLRKVRMKLPGRGKSSGARAIYLYLPTVELVVFVFVYTKAGQPDLTPDQRRRLRLLAKRVETTYAKDRN